MSRTTPHPPASSAAADAFASKAAPDCSGWQASSWMVMFSPKTSCRSIVQEAAAIANGGAAEIAEHLAHQVEHGRRFQDDGVASGGQHAPGRRIVTLARGAAGQSSGVELVEVAGAGLGPTGGIASA